MSWLRNSCSRTDRHIQRPLAFAGVKSDSEKHCQRAPAPAFVYRRLELFLLHALMNEHKTERERRRLETDGEQQRISTVRCHYNTTNCNAMEFECLSCTACSARRRVAYYPSVNIARFRVADSAKLTIDNSTYGMGYASVIWMPNPQSRPVNPTSPLIKVCGPEGLPGWCGCSDRDRFPPSRYRPARSTGSCAWRLRRCAGF
jgi:hypothetical protein